jgi:GMP synthase (glutamine-hydrolysing)
VPGRFLVLQHQDDCPPALLGEWLNGAGCALDVRRPYAGDELPADLADHDGLVVLGGSMGATDDADHAWLAPTRALIREAAASGTPALGVCLGHQLAAVALGGEVERNPRGQMLGLLPMGWTGEASDDRLVGSVLGADLGVYWNDDVVTRAPAGTVALACSPAGDLQAVRFAPTVWGVQLHPEVDEQILRTWAMEDPDRYADGVLEKVLDEVAAARRDLESGWRPLAHALAAMT